MTLLFKPLFFKRLFSFQLQFDLAPSRTVVEITYNHIGNEQDIFVVESTVLTGAAKQKEETPFRCLFFMEVASGFEPE